MDKIIINTEYIKLGQALKLCGAVSSGIEAKINILDGNVKVNNVVENRRGKKLVVNDIISFQNKDYIISK